jgi:hypothetical protein
MKDFQATGETSKDDIQHFQTMRLLTFFILWAFDAHPDPDPGIPNVDPYPDPADLLKVMRIHAEMDPQHW